MSRSFLNQHRQRNPFINRSTLLRSRVFSCETTAPHPSTPSLLHGAFVGFGSKPVLEETPKKIRKQSPKIAVNRTCSYLLHIFGSLLKPTTCANQHKIRNYFTIGDRTGGGLLRKITVNFPFFREIVTEKHVLNWWTIGKSSINIPIQRREINKDTFFLFCPAKWCIHPKSF